MKYVFLFIYLFVDYPFYNEGYNSYVILCSLPIIKPLKPNSYLSQTSLKREKLGQIGGVYGVVNTESSLHYIDSSLNSYIILIGSY
jgi:hypothetical protein